MENHDVSITFEQLLIHNQLRSCSDGRMLRMLQCACPLAISPRRTQLVTSSFVTYSPSRWSGLGLCLSPASFICSIRSDPAVRGVLLRKTRLSIPQDAPAAHRPATLPKQKGFHLPSKDSKLTVGRYHGHPFLPPARTQPRASRRGDLAIVCL